MGGVRRFLNLIVDNRGRGTTSLRRIDLNRQKLFNTSAPALWTSGSGSESEGEPQDISPWAPGSVTCSQKKKQAASAALKLGRISLPGPSFNFGASVDLRMQCFPVADSSLFCADQLGRSFLFEADTRHLVTLPRLRKPKLMPISLFIPSADLSDLENGRGSFFIMERIPKPEVGCSAQESGQFEAFVYGRVSWCYRKCWSSKLVPPPPYIRDITCLDSCPEISSYAVVGSEICISVNGVGTYCLDMTNYTWREVGKWMLPFYGKVEYVAEQKLWFGLSATDRHFAAADLSVMESQPQLMGTLKDLNLHEEWKECKDPQLVYLGSGRFCIARFLHTKTPRGYK